ncbi:acyltransferase [Methanopyrus sp.]
MQPLTRRNKDEHPAVLDPDRTIVLGDVRVSRDSVIGPEVRLGPDATIDGAVVSGRCVIYNCELGRCAVGPRTTVTGEVGDGVTIHPGTVLGQLRVSGEIEPPEVGEGAFLGPGVSILPGTVIGSESVVMPDSVVTERVPRRGVVSGNPAMPIGMVVDAETLTLEFDGKQLSLEGKRGTAFDVRLSGGGLEINEGDPDDFGAVLEKDVVKIVRMGFAVPLPADRPFSIPLHVLKVRTKG